MAIAVQLVHSTFGCSVSLNLSENNLSFASHRPLLEALLWKMLFEGETGVYGKPFNFTQVGPLARLMKHHKPSRFLISTWPNKLPLTFQEAPHWRVTASGRTPSQRIVPLTYSFFKPPNAAGDFFHTLPLSQRFSKAAEWALSFGRGDVFESQILRKPSKAEKRVRETMASFVQHRFAFLDYSNSPIKVDTCTGAVFWRHGFSECPC